MSTPTTSHSSQFTEDHIRVDSDSRTSPPVNKQALGSDGVKPASIGKQAITLIIGRGLSSAFTFLIPIVLARHLSISDYGTFKQIFLIYSSLFLILPFGIIQSLYYFIPKDSDHTRSYLAQSLLFLQLSGLVALGFLGLFRENIANYMNNPDLSPYLLQMGFFIFFMLSSHYFEALLISSQKINQAAFLGFLSEASKTACMLLPLFLFGRLSHLMWGMILFSFFRFCFVLGYVVRTYRLSMKDFHPGTFRQQLLYSVPFGLAVILQVTQDKFHQYVVSYSYNAAFFAIYTVAMFHLPLLELIYTPMSQLVIVRMTSLRQGAGQRAGRDEIAALWFDITKKMAMIFFPAFIFLQLMAYDLIAFLFTPSYLPSVPLFRIALLSLVTAVFLTEAVLRAYAATQFILKINLMNLIFTVLLVFPFLSWFGLAGGLLTLVTVVFLSKIVMLWEISRLVPFSLSTLLPWRDLLGIGVFSVLASVPVVFIKGIHLSRFTALAVSAVLFTVFYLIFLLTSHLISFDEKRELVRIVRRVGQYFHIPATLKS